MLNQLLQISNMTDYLGYFIDRVNEETFETKFPKVRQRILQNCTQLSEKIQKITGENFFQHITEINNLEAEIWIALEMVEIDDKLNFFEEEILAIAHNDCQTYFKEKCGMNLSKKTPHSLHFLA